MERPSGIDATLHCPFVWKKCSVSTRSRVRFGALLAVSLIEPAAIQFHFAGLFCACLGKRSRHNAKLFFSVLVRWMRVAGTILLLGGFLLCVSIVWAAVGFPMIGLGLVCLLIAERRKKQLIAPVVMRSDPVDRRQ